MGFLPGEVAEGDGPFVGGVFLFESGAGDLGGRSRAVAFGDASEGIEEEDTEGWGAERTTGANGKFEASGGVAARLEELENGVGGEGGRGVEEESLESIEVGFGGGTCFEEGEKEFDGVGGGMAAGGRGSRINGRGSGKFWGYLEGAIGRGEWIFGGGTIILEEPDEGEEGEE